MEKNRKRALRRFHNKRMLNHAKQVIKTWYFSEEDRKREEHLIHKWARQMQDNMKICSCAGCGNPRHGIFNGRRERLTMQELKSEDSYLDAINEYYEKNRQRRSKGVT